MWDWLQGHAPHLAHNWKLEVSDEVKNFAERSKVMIPSGPIQVLGQHMVASTVIERWGLNKVAILAGGTPTPLSPKPGQILYFTDANPEAVAEAQAAGYNALRVNVVSADDLKQLNGAKTAIATGLFHFLPDAAVQSLFHNLSEAGFETIIFTQGTKAANPEFAEGYAKFGVKVILRYVDDIRRLLPDNWRIDEVSPTSELLQHVREIGPYFAQMPHIIDLYRVVRV